MPSNAVKRKIVYNEQILWLKVSVMMGKGKVLRNILVYLLLFLMSFMVFDSTTLMIGVFIALAALYHFTHKMYLRNKL